MDCVQVAKRGSTITTGAASANVAIPTDQGGNAPNYVRIAASAAAYVAMGTSNAVTAAAGDFMVQPGDSIVVRAAGFTYIAAIQVAAAGTVQISPLENV